MKRFHIEFTKDDLKLLLKLLAWGNGALMKSSRQEDRDLVPIAMQLIVSLSHHVEADE